MADNEEIKRALAAHLNFGTHEVEGGTLHVVPAGMPPLKSEGGWYIEGVNGQTLSFCPRAK